MFQEPDYTTPLGRLSLRARRVPAFIRIPLLLLGFAAALLCAILDAGPYAFIANAQASIFDGEHYLALTFLFTVMVFLTPVGLVLHAIAGQFKDNRPAYLPPQEPLPPNAGPMPAYMQSGPYAQGPHGQAPHGQAPYQGPHGQAPYQGPRGPGTQGPTG